MSSKLYVGGAGALAEPIVWRGSSAPARPASKPHSADDEDAARLKDAYARGAAAGEAAALQRASERLAPALSNLGAMLEELCEHSGLKVERISYCSGYASQKVAAVMRRLSAINVLLAWSLTLPLRALPPLLDPIITVLLGWPYLSICLEAYKPRQFPERTL